MVTFAALGMGVVSQGVVLRESSYSLRSRMVYLVRALMR